MKRIGLIVNHSRERAAEGEVLLRRLAAERRIELLPVERASEAEAVIVLGGDGSMLSAAHCLTGFKLPLIGFNAGSLGYLTSVEECNFGAALDDLAAGRFTIEECGVLSTRIFDSAGNLRRIMRDAMNDVVVARGATGRALSLTVTIDGRTVTTYVCDGIILSTPLGSTAYSLSVGGPIVIAGSPTLVLSVISPHTLSSRPLVLSDRSVVRIAQSGGGPVPWMAFSDGQEDVALAVGECAEIVKGDGTVPVIRLPDYDPFSVLRRKLGWGGERNIG